LHQQSKQNYSRKVTKKPNLMIPSRWTIFKNHIRKMASFRDAN
jgi:hypothetical protein